MERLTTAAPPAPLPAQASPSPPAGLSPSLTAPPRSRSGSLSRSRSRAALPFDVTSVPRARHLARERLAGWGLAEHVEVAELLVSELVTNALRHARGPIGLTLAAHDGTLRCEVADTSPDLPRLCRVEDDDECGRGLHLLDTLSRWGSTPTPTGKVVWFELPSDPPSAGLG